MRNSVRWFGIAAMIIIADQLSKWLVTEHFRFGEVYPVTGFFNLVLVYNQGAAFSLLANAGGWQRPFFIGLGLLTTLAISYFLRQHPQQPRVCWALSLIMGGASGNVIDRVYLGHVIDFLDFYLAKWHWPAFNLADIAIVLGALLLVLDGFLVTPTQKNKPSTS